MQIKEETGKQTTVLGALMELYLSCKTGEAAPCASAIGRWGRVCMRFHGVGAEPGARLQAGGGGPCHAARLTR